VPVQCNRHSSQQLLAVAILFDSEKAWLLMSVICAELAEKLDSGHDAVLLAMDDAGVSEVLAAVTQAAQQGSARLDHGATTHLFRIEANAADVEFDRGAVVWRLDAAKAAELIELLSSMVGSGIPEGHHYLEGMSTPTETIVLSRNEYALNLLPPEAVYPPPAPTTCTGTGGL
jgi:hypothetical protein